MRVCFYGFLLLIEPTRFLSVLSFYVALLLVRRSLTLTPLIRRLRRHLPPKGGRLGFFFATFSHLPQLASCAGFYVVYDVVTDAVIIAVAGLVGVAQGEDAEACKMGVACAVAGLVAFFFMLHAVELYGELGLGDIEIEDVVVYDVLAFYDDWQGFEKIVPQVPFIGR